MPVYSVTTYQVPCKSTLILGEADRAMGLNSLADLKSHNHIQRHVELAFAAPDVCICMEESLCPLDSQNFF